MRYRLYSPGSAQSRLFCCVTLKVSQPLSKQVSPLLNGNLKGGLAVVGKSQSTECVKSVFVYIQGLLLPFLDSGRLPESKRSTM